MPKLRAISGRVQLPADYTVKEAPQQP